MQDLNERSADKIEFYYTGIEDPKIKLTVSFHIDNAEPKYFMTQRHEAIKAIYKTFADHNIIKLTILQAKTDA